ncbi:MAG TPA: hypothetical protein DCM28_04095 [Phycisphaerales bacterium]|nr:hypothetical protein [Phycisphaerales bacterium]HCD31716.1 hypothetical protein [Phycisphaerales bacterium]
MKQNLYPQTRRYSTEHQSVLPMGFTLIELLVVISIVSLLISILLPSLKNARSLARSAQCMSNQRSVGALMFIYSQDYDQYLPVRRTLKSGVYQYGWPNLIWKYMDTGRKLGNKYDKGKLVGTAMNCPEGQTDIKDNPHWGRIYTLNQWFKLPNNNSIYQSANKSIRISDIKKSSKVFLLSEQTVKAAWAGNKWIFADYTTNPLNHSQQQLVNHHTASKATNATYSDGHVKLMDEQDFPHINATTFVTERYDYRWHGSTNK